MAGVTGMSLFIVHLNEVLRGEPNPISIQEFSWNEL